MKKLMVAGKIEPRGRGHYEVPVTCGNCRWHGPWKIERGILAETELSSAECPKCGLRGRLHRGWGGQA